MEEENQAIQKTKSLIDQYMEKLQRLFMWYCSVGDNTNSNKMPQTKFAKFLKDCKLVRTN